MQAIITLWSLGEEVSTFFVLAGFFWGEIASKKKICRVLNKKIYSCFFSIFL